MLAPVWCNRVAVFGLGCVSHIFTSGAISQSAGLETKFAAEEIKAPSAVVQLCGCDSVVAGFDLRYFLFHAAMDWSAAQKACLMFVGFGETDEWAHPGRYDHYPRPLVTWTACSAALETANPWAVSRQDDVHYYCRSRRRGSGPTDWKNHGEKIAGAEVLIAVIGSTHRRSVNGRRSNR
jgi:hypothetical protein